MVMFISAPDARAENKNGQKDSLANILETREFGVNIVGQKQAKQMVKSSQPVGANIDEFDHAALTKIAGQKISAPLVAGAPAHLECVYYDHINLPENGNGSHSVMVLGHIVIHIDDNMVKTAGGCDPLSARFSAGLYGLRQYTDIYEMTLSEKGLSKGAIFDIYPNIAT